MRKDIILFCMSILLIHCLTGCVPQGMGIEPEPAESVPAETITDPSSTGPARPRPPYRETSDAFYAGLDAILRVAKMSTQGSEVDAETDSSADPAPVPNRGITTGPLKILEPPPYLITRKIPLKPSGRREWRTEYATRPERFFEAAFYLFHEKDYEQGREAFRNFIDLFPNSRLVDQAHYWIGECFYAQGLFEEAVQAYRMVLTRSDSDRKLADAFFKTGLCYHRLNASGKQKECWERLLQRYPDSRAAELTRRFMLKSSA
jgi:tol-pal system protein YbgF